MNFSEITKALKEISSISSNLEKLEWLKNHDDKDLKNIFKWYFDSSKITGIAEKKFDKNISLLSGMDFVTCDIKTFDDVIRYLEYHNTGTDSDICEIKDLMSQICSNDEEKETFKKLVCKNYPMGIDYKTINKVYPNFIPSYEVMLADKYLDLNDNKNAKLFTSGRQFCIQEKLDGFRCTAWKENGNVKLISRQGKLIEGLIDIENTIKNIELDNFVLDGELLITDRENVDSKEQYKATSKIVSTKQKEKHGITFNVFDIISIDEWNGKKCLRNYSERYTDLVNFIKTQKRILNVVDNLYIGDDENKILVYLQWAKSNNWEGIMVRFMDSKYEWKRSSNLLKVKPFLEMDMVITGYEEGTNSNKNKLGALLCEIGYKDYDRIKCKVGGGYSDDERIAFWKIKEELIGRIISVQYFEITQNTTTKEYSLRFPEFLELKPLGQRPNN